MTASSSPSDKVLLEYDGPVAIISNNSPDKRNAFDDEMDLRLFEILAELSERPDIRAVIWRGVPSSITKTASYVRAIIRRAHPAKGRGCSKRAKANACW